MDFSMWTRGDFLALAAVLITFFGVLAATITSIIISALSRPRIRIRISVYRRKNHGNKKHIQFLITNLGATAITVTTASIAQSSVWRPDRFKQFEHILNLIKDHVLKPGRVWRHDIPLSDLQPFLDKYTYFCLYHSQKTKPIFKRINTNKLFDVYQ